MHKKDGFVQPPFCMLIPAISSSQYEHNIEQNQK